MSFNVFQYLATALQGIGFIREVLVPLWIVVREWLPAQKRPRKSSNAHVVSRIATPIDPLEDRPQLRFLSGMNEAHPRQLTLQMGREFRVVFAIL